MWKDKKKKSIQKHFRYNYIYGTEDGHAIILVTLAFV